jgi:hypothetical protein
MALKGITDEVARARKLTYMCGLWKEQLLTDLLWFAIEGPGQRLLSRDGGATVGPAWSWASIEGVVALPETSLEGIRNVKKLVTIEDSGPDRSGNAVEITITLRGPLLPVSYLTAYRCGVSMLVRGAWPQLDSSLMSKNRISARCLIWHALHS